MILSECSPGWVKQLRFEPNSFTGVEGWTEGRKIICSLQKTGTNPSKPIFGCYFSLMILFQRRIFSCLFKDFGWDSHWNKEFFCIQEPVSWTFQTRPKNNPNVSSSVTETCLWPQLGVLHTENRILLWQMITSTPVFWLFMQNSWEVLIFSTLWSLVKKYIWIEIVFQLFRKLDFDQLENKVCDWKSVVLFDMSQCMFAWC